MIILLAFVALIAVNVLVVVVPVLVVIHHEHASRWHHADDVALRRFTEGRVS